MKTILRKLLCIALCLNLNLFADTNCQHLLNWIYKDLTLQNLDKSYERLMNKMLLGIIHVHKNTKDQYAYEPELAKILNSLKSIDPLLDVYIKDSNIITIHEYIPFWGNKKLNESNISNVISEWKKLQTTSPDLFEGMDKKYQLDQWDIVTSKILDESLNIGSKNERYKEKILLLGKDLRTIKSDALKGRSFNLKRLRNSINLTQKELMTFLKNNYHEIQNEFKGLCSQEEIIKLVQTENYVCPRKNDLNSTKEAQFLDQMGLVLSSLNGDLLPAITTQMRPKYTNLSKTPNIHINTPNYRTNKNNPKSTYCLRDPNLATMIVIHHAAMNSSHQDVNSLHLRRGGIKDPWLMVGYNYLVENEDPNWRSRHKSSDPPKVYSGRPLKIQGAHAGGYTPPLTKPQKDFFKNKYVYCGNDHIGFKKIPALNKRNSEGGISGNLTSFGVSVLGFYSGTKFVDTGGANLPINIESPWYDGFLPDFISDFFKEDNSLKYNEIDKNKFEEVLETLAKLSCDIQKKYPDVKTIVPHHYFKDGVNGRKYTECPGKIIDYIGTIGKKAEKYGCKFKHIITRDK